jgi:enamine deaminase RidA (YjgF/YER057c/UK114 family)
MAHEKVKAKLAELGLELPAAAAPVAAYLPAIKNDKLVFTAGQLPTVDGAISILAAKSPCVKKPLRFKASSTVCLRSG